MAAPKPTMRRKRPSAEALDFIEGKDSKKARQKARPKAKPKNKPEPRKSLEEKTAAQEERVPKRLYLPVDVERKLVERAFEERVQQSEIATAALRLYLGL